MKIFFDSGDKLVQKPLRQKPLFQMKLSRVFYFVQSGMRCASVAALVCRRCTAQQIPPHGFSTSTAVCGALTGAALPTCLPGSPETTTTSLSEQSGDVYPDGHPGYIPGGFTPAVLCPVFSPEKRAPETEPFAHLQAGPPCTFPPDTARVSLPYPAAKDRRAFLPLQLL